VLVGEAEEKEIGATYNCYTIIVDVCLVVEFIFKFGVLDLGKYSTGMQACCVVSFHVGYVYLQLDEPVRLTLGLLVTTVQIQGQQLSKKHAKDMWHCNHG
jgi:hypothetical protein